MFARQNVHSLVVAGPGLLVLSLLFLASCSPAPEPVDEQLTIQDLAAVPSSESQFSTMTDPPPVSELTRSRNTRDPAPEMDTRPATVPDGHDGTLTPRDLAPPAEPTVEQDPIGPRPVTDPGGEGEGDTSWPSGTGAEAQPGDPGDDSDGAWPGRTVPVAPSNPGPLGPDPNAAKAGPYGGPSRSEGDPEAEGPARITIPRGTLIPAVTSLTISTRTHASGDVFFASVSEEILASDGMVLVPEGSRIEVIVADASKSEDSQEEAYLTVDFAALWLGEVRVPLDAVLQEAEIETSTAASDTRTALKVAAGAAAGAVIGRILGGDGRSAVQGAAAGALGGAGVAYITHDGHAVIREGTTLVARLESPALLD